MFIIKEKNMGRANNEDNRKSLCKECQDVRKRPAREGTVFRKTAYEASDLPLYAGEFQGLPRKKDAR